MKNACFLMLALLASTFSGYAQIALEATPPSFKENDLSFSIESYRFEPFDYARISAEDEADEKQGNYPKIGRFLPSHLTLNDGVWHEFDNGDRLWQFKLESEGAKALSVQFESFSLPAGSQLFIYADDKSHVIGAFSDHNNAVNGIFSTQLVISDAVVVEYFEPAAVRDQGSFTISGVYHCYRMVSEADYAGANRDFGESDPCQVNANCSEGQNWQNQKRGVVRILVIEGQFAGWCSGSLINNTAQDCRPFILSALHCGQNASANNMNQWIFYFNYEASACSNPFSEGNLANQTISGCVRRADSGDNGGDQGSDFLLVELNNSVPAAYNAYYNGWRRNNVTSPSGVSIHHPSGDIKKISTYTTNLQNDSWGTGSGSHWRVNWSSTANGHGVTEGGSSGSPIFDNQGLIIGTLTGGSSFCSTPNFPDLYGKMSYHWSSNPGDNLSTWLDPLNTGVISLTGSNNPCGGQGPNDCASVIPYPFSDPCVQFTIAEDDYCCETEWDDLCQSIYDACNEQEGDCEATIPYPFSDPCVQFVIAEDDYCCDTEWDQICEDLYVDCNGGGSNDDCLQGNISVSQNQTVCPQDPGIFNVNGAAWPAGGGYGIAFTSAGGSGGLAGGFTLTGVTLPVSIDAGLGGVLAQNQLAPLSGAWQVVGVAYSNENDIENSICGFTSQSVIYNFLPQSAPECGTGIDESTALADRISVYPNPGSEVLNIRLTGNFDAAVMIEAIDAVGRRIYFNQWQPTVQGELVVPIAEWSVGVYMLRFQYEHSVATTRFVKNR